MKTEKLDNRILLSIESEKLFYTGHRCITVTPGTLVLKGLTVLTGKNGSGKTTFAQILEKGRNFRTNRIRHYSSHNPKIKCIEFQNIHSLPGVNIEYYQQRYEETMNDDIPTVGDILKEKIDNPDFKKLTQDFNLKDAEEKKVNSLSSGELRKLLIINSIMDAPDLLILDNPYIGLDAPSRLTLNDALKKLKESGKSVMLIVQDENDAPDFTDNYLYARDFTISENPLKVARLSYRSFPFRQSEDEIHPTEGENFTPALNQEKENFHGVICCLKDCEVKYAGRAILQHLNWTVREGERWILSGPNGSGKSTLLSLLNADNPKSYCNDISLFGQKRGSGESIWDIKRKIGFVSPEMQLHFHGSGTVMEIVANGLNDTVGLYVKPTPEQKEKAGRWLEHFRLLHLKDRLFKDLSSGERQMVLIARSFIKEPKLLILDEPMHGLDPDNKNLVMHTIEEFLNVRKDVAFIMVTHNPEELPDVFDKHLRLG